VVEFLQNLWERLFESDRLGGMARSGSWGKFKRDFEKSCPKQCAICGNKKSQLHHVTPFSVDPSMELDVTNVLWLCEGLGTLNHHRGVGHLGSFLSYNKEIFTDARIWFNKFQHRP